MSFKSLGRAHKLSSKYIFPQAASSLASRYVAYRSFSGSRTAPQLSLHRKVTLPSMSNLHCGIRTMTSQHVSPQGNYIVRPLINPTRAEAAATEQTLAEAVETNPFIMMLLGNDPSLSLPLARCFVTAAVLDGDVHVAEDSTREIAGVAIWFGPGKEFLQSKIQQEQALEPMLDSFGPKIGAFWEKVFIPEYDSFLEDALGPGVLLNSLHAQLIGVSPKHRRSGLARRLGKIGITQVRLTSLSVYRFRTTASASYQAEAEGYNVTAEPCITSMHVMCENLSFETCGVRSFKGPDGTGEGQLWSMILRPPGNNNKK